ncbi:autophagy protein 16 [Echria macrotheca]|uniref:Autophagy protein 16 n=1 Tax=Echria macrotheca TaxID=438768 RepID=A0AAJ0F7Z8_9PEZI|nr:autophagy protein 16 [Echria macrotheca]
MTSWRDEFLAGILDAERTDPLLRELVTTCSLLTDRVSVLEAENAVLKAEQQTSPSPTPSRTASRNQASKTTAVEQQDTDSATTARLRLQLAEALRARGQSQSRLQAAEEELGRLRAKTAADSKALAQLTAERRKLNIKLRDREEELRVKTKLAADVQDELAVLNITLNMSEKQLADKKAENKQLIERFMKRVGQEVDAMNNANEPLFTKK